MVDTTRMFLIWGELFVAACYCELTLRGCDYFIELAVAVFGKLLGCCLCIGNRFFHHFLLYVVEIGVFICYGIFISSVHNRDAFFQQLALTGYDFTNFCHLSRRYRDYRSNVVSLVRFVGSVAVEHAI